MPVDFGEGEEVGAVEDGVEVVDAVEDGDEVEEGGEEADDELCQDGFGDILTWSWREVELVGGLGKGVDTDLGISSARWVITSGVPTANAPFSIPEQNTNPLLAYPVSFSHSRQTKAVDA